MTDDNQFSFNPDRAPLASRTDGIDLVARGMPWVDEHALIRECALQAGMSDKFEGASPMALNLLHRVAMAAHKAGFTEARDRLLAPAARGAEAAAQVCAGGPGECAFNNACMYQCAAPAAPRDLVTPDEALATQPEAAAVPAGLDSRYEPNGAIKGALQWLKSALDCPVFHWDGDQHDCATAALTDAHAEWSSLVAASTAAPPVPAGWKLVPVSPTDEMTQAMYTELGSPSDYCGGIEEGWFAMLTAAPTAPPIVERHGVGDYSISASAAIKAPVKFAAPAVEVPPMLTDERIGEHEAVAFAESADPNWHCILQFAEAIIAERDKQWLAASGVQS